MNLPPLPPAVAVMTVQPVGARWKVTSSDGSFEGVLADARTAFRCAKAEAEAHPGHVVALAPLTSPRAKARGEDRSRSDQVGATPTVVMPRASFNTESPPPGAR